MAKHFRRGKKGTLFHILAMTLLGFYVVLAGFSPSVTRAAAMIGIHLSAGILHRRYDLLSAAGAVFLLMLAGQPFRLFNTGFQLSFLAVASLGVILPYVQNIYKGAFLTTVSIQLGMVPYTAFVFNFISWSALAANVPVVFIAGIILPAALILPVASVSEFLLRIMSDMLEAGCDILIDVNDFFYAEGRMGSDAVSMPEWLLITYYGVLFFMLSEKGQLMRLRKQWKNIACV